MITSMITIVVVSNMSICIQVFGQIQSSRVWKWQSHWDLYSSTNQDLYLPHVEVIEVTTMINVATKTIGKQK